MGPLCLYAALASPLGRLCLGRTSLELITFVILRVLMQVGALRLRQTDAGQRDVWNHSRAVSRGGRRGEGWRAGRHPVSGAPPRPEK